MGAQTLNRSDVEVLEALWLVTQPQPAEALRYEYHPDAEGKQLPRPPKVGYLTTLEQLRDLMHVMAANPLDSFVIIDPPSGGWFVQTYHDDAGWVVEIGLSRGPGEGNDIIHYLNQGDHHFPMAAAYGMLCELILRQRLPFEQECEVYEF